MIDADYVELWLAVAEMLSDGRHVGISCMAGYARSLMTSNHIKYLTRIYNAFYMPV